ncbi:flagellar motor protein MotB [Nocardioides sp. TRM66260-LWL]|uniref:OmpA/MotB family protein n=1 Tax=Nocardioides sp. TRM66260-LWL TaxID=2874478 RepID=UPI001CC558F5|nr:flagellar motor protein MotB [Nocardioides sp. TRM66260-LWL]MBZ5735190.1 flagellar motor protein MotB [Nocardioides sp. TRM66260-LWL]
MSGHGGHGRRAKHEEHEEHENHERWLVTYADMVTLLMVLFIVMFAMSQVDQKKFLMLKEGLAAGFGASDSILDGNTSIQDQPGMSAIGPIAPNLTTADLSVEQSKQVDEAVEAGMQQQSAQAQQRQFAAARAEVQRLDGVRQALMAALKAKGLAGDVRTSYDERGLVVSLVSRHIVFDADSAVLTPRGAAVVDALAPALKALPEDLEIDGHTNQEKVKPKYFASDWDLSAARAVTVLRRLNERFGVPADRLRLAAFGDTKPLIPVSRPDSQEINKRVDVIVLTGLSADNAAQLPDAAASLGLPSVGTLSGARAAQDRTAAGVDPSDPTAGADAARAGAEPDPIGRADAGASAAAPATRTPARTAGSDTRPDTRTARGAIR